MTIDHDLTGIIVLSRTKYLLNKKKTTDINLDGHEIKHLVIQTLLNHQLLAASVTFSCFSPFTLTELSSQRLKQEMVQFEERKKRKCTFFFKDERKVKYMITVT